jgi:hypothetical protein
MVSGIDWAQACNTALKRPVPEMRAASIAANGVAVSHITLPGRCAASRRLLTPLTDFGLRYCCRYLCYFPFAGLQAAALEAQRQRSPPNLHSQPTRGLIYLKRWMATAFGKICVGLAAGCCLAP